MRNLTNFDSNTLKFQKFALKGTYFYLELKKYTGVMFDGT